MIDQKVIRRWQIAHACAAGTYNHSNVAAMRKVQMQTRGIASELYYESEELSSQ